MAQPAVTPSDPDPGSDWTMAEDEGPAPEAVAATPNADPATPGAGDGLPEQLTDTAQACIQELKMRSDDIVAQIDQAIAAATTLLDGIKETVVARLSGMKNDVVSYSSGEIKNLTNTSTVTLDNSNRLLLARQLVSTLGIELHSLPVTTEEATMS